MKNLTPNDYYEARNALGLSLAQVAKESGINRNYLSNFEKKKYFLDDQAKARLRDFYLNIDPSVFDEESETQAPEKDASEVEANSVHSVTEKPVKRDTVSLLAEMGYRLVDGRYVAPSEIEADVVDSVREEMTDIDDQIAELVASPLPMRDGGFFSDGVELDSIKALKQSLKVITLLARKQLQHDILQGSAQLEPIAVEGKALEVSGGDVEGMTLGEYAGRLIHAGNDWLSEVA